MVVLPQAGESGAPGCKEQGPGQNSDRRLCARQARTEGLEDAARSGSRHLGSARIFRPHWLIAHSG